MRRSPGHSSSLRALGLALTLVAACLLAALPAPALSEGASPAIVGGGEIPITSAPWQVALYDPQIDPDPADSQFCGGVILDATHVLTAAHCVFDEATGQASAPAEVEVLAGTADLETKDPTNTELEEDPVAATSFDPEWSRTTGAHDLGVLTLKNALKIATNIAPIQPLSEAEAATTHVAEAGKPAIVSGWGDERAGPPTTVRSDYPTILQATPVPIVGDEACASDYTAAGSQPPPFPEFVCAGQPGGGACYGDSGGPLSVEPTGGPRLLGIVDLGVGCGGAVPGAYQSVLDAENASFVKSDPPAGPRWSSGSAPGVSGTPQAGQTLTCEQGQWAVEPEKVRYQFFADESTVSGPHLKELSVRSTTSTFDLPSTLAVGSRIVCAVLAEGPGGFAEAFSPDVTVTAVAPKTEPEPNPLPAPPPISPPPTVEASTPQPTTQSPAPSVTPRAGSSSVGPTVLAPPSLRVVSRRCQRSACTVEVLASEGVGVAAVAKVEALLSFMQSYPCHEGHLQFTCTRKVTRGLSARATPAGRFVILASGLKPAAYTLELVAIDRAGLYQLRPVRVGLRVVRSGRSRR